MVALTQRGEPVKGISGATLDRWGVQPPLVQLVRRRRELEYPCTSDSPMDWFQLRDLMLIAVRSGGTRHGLTLVSWDVSGNCRSPAERVHRARAYQGRRLAPSLELQMVVRCRRCDSCRQIRRKVWTARARAETQAAPRTWFGTLTLRSEEHYRFLAKARKLADTRTDNFDALPYWEQFDRRHRAIAPELTKYLKRVRSVSDAPLRYLLVAEAHKSGAPHYHLLVHEVDPDRQVKHRQLSEQWGLGFSQWKLVTDTRSATYLCKYLSKSNAARVRASLRYGRNDLASQEAPSLTGLKRPMVIAAQSASVKLTTNETTPCYVTAHS